MSSEEEILRFALRFEQKPCKYQWRDCGCCFTCRWVYICYQTWRRGNFRICRNPQVSKGNPIWCNAVADRIAELLGHKKKWRIAQEHPPIPLDKIEKWDEE